MTDFVTVQKQWEAQRREEEQEVRLKLQDVLTTVTELVMIEVDYDGYGDEGNIRQTRCFGTDNQEIEVPGKDLLEGVVEEYAYCLLDRHHPGWEINEGSYGTITIDVPTLKISCTHSERYVTEETEEWEEE